MATIMQRILKASFVKKRMNDERKKRRAGNKNRKVYLLQGRCSHHNAALLLTKRRSDNPMILLVSQQKMFRVYKVTRSLIWKPGSDIDSNSTLGTCCYTNQTTCSCSTALYNLKLELVVEKLHGLQEYVPRPLSYSYIQAC